MASMNRLRNLLEAMAATGKPTFMNVLARPVPMMEDHQISNPTTAISTNTQAIY